MKIEKFNSEFRIESHEVKLTNGDIKIVHTCLVIDFLKTTWQTRDAIRKEMESKFMYKQGFFTFPKFIDMNGVVILDKCSVIEINDKYPGFKWVFYVEENNLELANEISKKYKVDFYKN